ncbi:alpha/beta fold hydrolase [Catellatospora coxensis]
MIRSVWWAATIPGHEALFDTAHLRVYYPARPDGSDRERLSGVMAADADGAPYPVAVIVSGVNVGQEAYRWLAERLAAQGVVAVTYDWVGTLFGGLHGITPGVDLDAARPDGYGKRPTTPSLRPVLDALAAMTGPVAGLLDLNKVALIGHSAGGTVALQSASFVPEVKAVATYGAHTMVATMLGWPAGTVLPPRPTARCCWSRAPTTGSSTARRTATARTRPPAATRSAAPSTRRCPTGAATTRWSGSPGRTTSRSCTRSTTPPRGRSSTSPPTATPPRTGNCWPTCSARSAGCT